MRGIVRGKERKIVEFGGKWKKILIEGIWFIEKV